MESGVFGRTNESFPNRWLSLGLPEQSEFESFAKAAVNANTVLNITGSPALWGGYFRATRSPLMVIGPADLHLANDELQASNLLQAHLLETLCGIGRDCIDFYFLPIRNQLQEFQINGALMALEEARREGSIRFAGLASFDTQMALNILHLHDAFEVLLLSERHAPLTLLAKSRRMAIVRSTFDLQLEPEADEAILYRVQSAGEIDRAVHGAYAG